MICRLPHGVKRCLEVGKRKKKKRSMLLSLSVCFWNRKRWRWSLSVVGVAGKPKPAKFGVNEPSLLTSFDAKQSDDDPSVSIHSCCKRYIGKELST